MLYIECGSFWSIMTFCDLDSSVLTDWWAFFTRGRHTAVRECSSDLCKQSELFRLYSDFPLFYSSPSDWIGLLHLLYLSSLKLSCSSVIHSRAWAHNLEWMKNAYFYSFSIIMTNNTYTTHEQTPIRNTKAAVWPETSSACYIKHTYTVYMFTYLPHTLLLLTPSGASFLMRLSLSDSYIQKNFLSVISQKENEKFWAGVPNWFAKWLHQPLVGAN